MSCFHLLWRCESEEVLLKWAEPLTRLGESETGWKRVGLSDFSGISWDACNNWLSGSRVPFFQSWLFLRCSYFSWYFSSQLWLHSRWYCNPLGPCSLLSAAIQLDLSVSVWSSGSLQVSVFSKSLAGVFRQSVLLWLEFCHLVFMVSFLQVSF